MFGCDDKRLSILEDRFMRHMEIEEETMKTLKENSRDQGEKIDRLCDAVSSLHNKIETVSLSHDIKIATSTENLKTHIHSHYATRKELSNGLNTIRDTARLIWIAIVAAVGVFVWLLDKVN